MQLQSARHTSITTIYPTTQVLASAASSTISTMANPAEKPSSLPDNKIEIINDTHGNNIDPIAEKKLLLKCDLRVLPPLFVLFLLAFLDRVNIGTVIHF
jgi:hypothetical protein